MKGMDCCTTSCSLPQKITKPFDFFPPLFQKLVQKLEYGQIIIICTDIFPPPPIATDMVSTVALKWGTSPATSSSSINFVFL